MFKHNKMCQDCNALKAFHKGRKKSGDILNFLEISLETLLNRICLL